jgi:hypothetical protein
MFEKSRVAIQARRFQVGANIEIETHRVFGREPAVGELGFRLSWPLAS